MPREFSRAWEEYAEHLCFVTETYFVPYQEPSLLMNKKSPVSMMVEDHNVAPGAKHMWSRNKDESFVNRIGMVIDRIFASANLGREQYLDINDEHRNEPLRIGKSPI